MDIVGLGTPIMDQVVNVPYMPPKDGAVHAKEIFNQGGGKVASGMAAAARLGKKAGMMARVGGDFTGDFIIQDFNYNGVDTSRILRDDKKTSSPYCIALSEEETGTRIFIGREFNVRSLTPEELDTEYIASAKILHLENGDEASTAAARFAKSKGVTVAMDGDHYTEAIEALLPQLDIFIGSEFYHKARYGDLDYRESCKRVQEQGPQVVWFTLGSKGCVGLVGEEWFELPCFPVNVRDSTGAGDVFHGAYLAALLDGMSHQECARFASAVSAIKCTCVGGRTGIPTRAIVDHFLQTGEIGETDFEERLQHYRKNF